MDYIVAKNNSRARYSPEKRKSFVEDEYLRSIGHELDWDNLQTYTEKMQYEKLYHLYPEKTRYSDKIAVRDYIRDRIGEEYLIPIYGVWNKFSDIDFDSLPQSFVLKTNHGSGTVWVIDDKDSINKKYLDGVITRWLKYKFQYKHFEMHYEGIIPKIYAEEKLAFSNGVEDYKFLCFDGVPKYCWVDFNRYTNHKRNIYDLNWNLQDWNQYNENTDIEIEKPKNFDLMIELATKLAQGFAHVRVDLYNIDGKIYFGEMTFTNGAGLKVIKPAKGDAILGSLWHLDQSKNSF